MKKKPIDVAAHYREQARLAAEDARMRRNAAVVPVLIAALSKIRDIANKAGDEWGIAAIAEQAIAETGAA